MKRIQFRLTAYTDAAGKRNDVPPLFGNEDNFFVDADLSNDQQGEFATDEAQMLSDYGSLLVVADGMGGMNAGEVASEIAIRTVKRFFSREKLTEDLIATAKSRERYMERIVAEADAAIKTHARENKECEGMGSTIIMVWVCAGVASVTWCGDSRAYLLREPKGIEQISKDHSYVQSLIDDNKITEDEAFDHPYGNIITRSLGDPEKRAQAESRTIPLYRHDIILVCSDGLSGVLRDHQVIAQNGGMGTEPNLEDLIRANRASMLQCREALWSAAEQAEWYDNVTAILYEITDGATKPQATAEKALPALDNKKYIHIRLNKNALWYTLASLVIIGILVCGFIILYFNKNESDWQQRYDKVRLRAEENGFTYISGRLDSLKPNDNEGLLELDGSIRGRAALLNRIDSLYPKEKPVPIDSLRGVICKESKIDVITIRARIDSLRNLGKAGRLQARPTVEGSDESNDSIAAGRTVEKTININLTESIPPSVSKDRADKPTSGNELTEADTTKLYIL